MKFISKLPMKFISKLPMKSIDKLSIKYIDKIPVKYIDKLPVKYTERYLINGVIISTIEDFAFNAHSLNLSYIIRSPYGLSSDPIPGDIYW